LGYGRLRQNFNKNSSENKIGERYRLNHAIVVKLYHPYLNFPVTFAYLICESRLFPHIVTCLIIMPYKYFYLFTEELLVDNIYGGCVNNTYLLVGLACCKDTQMKAYDITRLIAALKSDNVQCRT